MRLLSAFTPPVMRRLACCLILAAFVVSTPRSAAAQSPTAGASVSPSDPALGPGDRVRLTVWRKPELSGDFTIAADGSISHPLYQAVKVAGLPISEATRRVNDFLKTYEQNPQVLIEPLFRITVGGEVRNPNLFTLERETTLSQAVAQAGGPTERGSLNRVLLIRNARETTIDLMDPAAQWPRAPIESGDQIIVQRRRDTFRDVILPIVSVAGALAAVSGLFINR